MENSENVFYTKCKEIATYYYDKRGIKPTQAQFTVTLQHAKSLLNKYEINHIKLGVDYNIAHKPPKGFISLSWLNYCLDDIIAEHKAKIILAQQDEDHEIKQVQQTKSSFERISNDKRVGDDFDFSAFR